MSGDHTRVRVADSGDEEALMKLARFLHAENGLFELDEAAVRYAFRKAVAGPVEQRHGVVGVIGDRDNIEGAIFLEPACLWYTTQPCFQELFSFVYPQFRSSSNSNDLIAFAKHVSDHFNLPLMIGVLSNYRTAAKVRLYRKALGEPAGAFFLHGGSTGRGVN
ncbi:MAG TPA: hypothetical protein VHE81_06520 [Lacipirellulaceae bacterium]|jgi:hypothetical protein|nr:hypothetical protein [Lacipirellulaceae bacterium]